MLMAQKQRELVLFVFDNCGSLDKVLKWPQELTVQKKCSLLLNEFCQQLRKHIGVAKEEDAEYGMV